MASSPKVGAPGRAYVPIDTPDYAKQVGKSGNPFGRAIRWLRHERAPLDRASVKQELAQRYGIAFDKQLNGWDQAYLEKGKLTQKKVAILEQSLKNNKRLDAAIHFISAKIPESGELCTLRSGEIAPRPEVKAFALEAYNAALKAHRFDTVEALSDEDLKSLLTKEIGVKVRNHFLGNVDAFGSANNVTSLSPGTVAALNDKWQGALKRELAAKAAELVKSKIHVSFAEEIEEEIPRAAVPAPAQEESKAPPIQLSIDNAGSGSEEAPAQLASAGKDGSSAFGHDASLEQASQSSEDTDHSEGSEEESSSHSSAQSAASNTESTSVAEPVQSTGAAPTSPSAPGKDRSAALREALSAIAAMESVPRPPPSQHGIFGRIVSHCVV